MSRDNVGSSMMAAREQGFASLGISPDNPVTYEDDVTSQRFQQFQSSGGGGGSRSLGGGGGGSRSSGGGGGGSRGGGGGRR